MAKNIEYLMEIWFVIYLMDYFEQRFNFLIAPCRSDVFSHFWSLQYLNLLYVFNLFIFLAYKLKKKDKPKGSFSTASK